MPRKISITCERGTEAIVIKRAGGGEYFLSFWVAAWESAQENTLLKRLKFAWNALELLKRDIDLMLGGEDDK